MYGTEHLQCDMAKRQCKIISQRLSTKRQSNLKWWVSTFQKQVNEKHEVNEKMLETTFTAIYCLAKEEISNRKLIPLLELLENLGVSELKYFPHRFRLTFWPVPKQFGANGEKAWCPLCTTFHILNHQTWCCISSEHWKSSQSLFSCCHAVFQGVSWWQNNSVHLCINVSVGQCSRQNLHCTNQR